MSTATRVPETSRLAAGELSADHAKDTLKRTGTRRLVRDSFARFRYGDGFSSARAMGFQFVLSFIPLVIAFVGLSTTLNTDRVAEVLRRTLLTLSPGSSGDAVEQALAGSQNSSGSGGQLALAVGLVTSLVALTTSMGQIERGANRIYGIHRDRPTLRKYGRAAVLALCGGIPAVVGFLILVAGGTVIDNLDAVYDLGSTQTTLAEWARWPLGVALDLLAVTVIFRWAPRRHQPTMSWLAFGAGLAVVLWLVFTALLALYVATSESFGRVYGPLTGIIALLLWSQLTSVALLFGLAFGAQLEAVRAGVLSPVMIDSEPGASSGSVAHQRV